MQVKVTFARAPKSGREGGYVLYKDVTDSLVAEGILRLIFGTEEVDQTSIIIPVHNILLVETEV